MTRPTLDVIVRHYQLNRRKNFAASQRLEGIETLTAEMRDSTEKLPTRTELKKKYALLRR